MSAEPVGSLGKIYIDVGDLTQAARFWGGLLGLEPRQPRSDPMGGRFVDVGAKLGTTMIVLQQVPEPHTVKNRLHLDINVSNLETAIQGVITLGGSKVRDMESGFAVMADPDGNEFCLIPRYGV